MCILYFDWLHKIHIGFISMPIFKSLIIPKQSTRGWKTEFISSSKIGLVWIGIRFQKTIGTPMANKTHIKCNLIISMCFGVNLNRTVCILSTPCFHLILLSFSLLLSFYQFHSVLMRVLGVLFFFTEKHLISIILNDLISLWCFDRICCHRSMCVCLHLHL